VSRTKVGPVSLLAVVREVRRGAGDPRPLGVAGARELVPLLARELREGGDPSAVAEQRVEGVAALLWVGEPDVDQLRRAARAGVPIVALSQAETLPYVLATDIVPALPGRGFPVEEIAEAVARKLGEDGTALAARLPAVRPAVCDWLIMSFSRRNGLTAALVFIPGVDLPLLTLRQIRLVLRIAIAHGHEIGGGARLREILGVIGAGFGLRTIARELLDVVPYAGWAIKGAVAYTGTRAVGEAAVRYFEALPPPR
jgi:uncharacterized protein (DUF697 family)